MNRKQAADEVKERFTDTFPEGAGELFYSLWTNVAHLHLNWKNYRALFGTSPERIQLLSWAASSFFGLLDGIVRHDVVLAISRLTDPPRSMGKDNASLAQLLERVTPFLDTDLGKEWKSELADLQADCKPIREIRNRILAHNDLATALKYHSDPMPGISRAYVEGVLAQIRRFLGDIEGHFCGSRTAYQQPLSIGDGEALISVLKNAREQESRRRWEFNQKYGIAGTGE